MSRSLPDDFVDFWTLVDDIGGIKTSMFIYKFFVKWFEY